MDSKLETLRSHPLCEGLLEEELARLASHTTPLELPAGAGIYHMGQTIETVHVLVSGRTRLTVPASGKAQPLELESLPGEVLGAVALFDAGRSVGDMVAIEPVQLLSLEREAFLELVQSIPRLALHLIRRIARRTVQVAGVDTEPSRARTVGVLCGGHRGRRLLELLGQALAARGARVARARSGEPGQVERWEQLLSSHDHVFLALEAGELSPGWIRWVSACDELLWLIDAENEPALRGALASLAGELPERAARSHVVWMITEGAQAAPPWDRAWDACGCQCSVLEVPEAPGRMTRLAQLGLDRLVRRLRGVRLGLALAGGGARGMAHLGAFRALERAGIGFDVLAGTSCGAMVGITYAAGFTPDFLVEAYKRDLTPSWIFRHLPKGNNWSLIWQFRTGAWDTKLRRYLRDWPLERLPIPFHAVTVDLISGRQVVHRSGDAVRAILESINLPVVSAPIIHDGMAMVDGAVLNNLPADVLVSDGADLVVGIDVSSQLKHELAGNRPDTPTEQMRSVGPVETVIRVLETQGRGLGALRADSMDLIIRPDASAFSFVDFSQAPALADVGEAAAEAAIPQLRQLIAAAEDRAVARQRLGTGGGKA